jgi:hypothetical protein
MKSNPVLKKKTNSFHHKYVKTGEYDRTHLLLVLLIVAITICSSEISEFLILNRLVYRVISKLRRSIMKRLSSDSHTILFVTKLETIFPPVTTLFYPIKKSFVM